MLELLAGFIVELREAGLPVSLTENLDAMEAVKHIPLEDREAFKYALAATLVKNNAHWRAFETVFEVYFSLRGGHHAIGDEGDDLAELLDDLEGEGEGDQGSEGEGMGRGGGGGEALTPEELAELLYQALLQGNDALLRAIARQAVRRFAGMEPGRPVGGTYYLYRTLRNLDLDAVLDKLMEQTRQQADDDGNPLTPARGAPRGGRVPDPHRGAEEGDRGRDPPAPGGRPGRRGDGPHAAQAAARGHRLHARQPGGDGRAAQGAVPADPPAGRAPGPQAPPRPQGPARLPQHRPPLAQLRRRAGRAQVPATRGPTSPRSSWSPTSPARWPPSPASRCMLVYAISNQFSKVRAFVFIDGIDEVTSFFEGVEDITEAVHRVNTEADVVWVDGHSDYGHAFEVFWERWGKEIGPKTTVMILGDARNNYHASQSWVVKEMQHRARHVYWLNPEPKSYWDTGDSIVGEYATYCDGTFECRNLRQLEKFVDHLA